MAWVIWIQAMCFFVICSLEQDNVVPQAADGGMGSLHWD